jgi:L-ascorbate metabolism protein UlaG (beta-lactamase superfamily)
MAFNLTWHGHGTFSIETGGHNILLDPFLADNPVCSTNPDEVECDFILVTHGHLDHLADAEPIAKRTGAPIITNFEISEWLNAKGITSHGQSIGGGYQHPFGHVKLTQAFHGSMLPDGANGGMPVGFLITTNDGDSIYFAGDTGLFSDMKLMRKDKVDLAILPIGDNYTMGPDDAVRATKFVRPKHVIPKHYNTFPLLNQDAGAWAAKIHAKTKAQAHVMTPGETLSF